MKIPHVCDKISICRKNNWTWKKNGELTVVENQLIGCQRNARAEKTFVNGWRAWRFIRSFGFCGSGRWMEPSILPRFWDIKCLLTFSFRRWKTNWPLDGYQHYRHYVINKSTFIENDRTDSIKLTGSTIDSSRAECLLWAVYAQSDPQNTEEQ